MLLLSSAAAITKLDDGYVFNFDGTDYSGQEFLVHLPGIGNVWVAVPHNHDLETGPTPLSLALDTAPPEGVDVDPSVKEQPRPSISELQDQLYKLLHDPRGAMKSSRPYLGEIRMWASPTLPPGWVFCDGRLLALSEHQALFEVIGNTYGGDGRTTMALPDLRGRVPVGTGAGAGLANRELGQEFGNESEVLAEAHLPPHDHALRASNSSATQTQPSGNVLARASTPQYLNASSSVIMGSSSIGSTGSGQAHPNVQPSTVLNFIIATDASRARPIHPSAAKWPVDPGFTSPRWKMRPAENAGQIESDAYTRPPFNAELTFFTSGGADYKTVDFLEHEDGIGTIWLAIPQAHDLSSSAVSPVIVLAPDIVEGDFIPWPDWVDDNTNGVQDIYESWVDTNGNGVRDWPGERVGPGGDGRTTWEMGHKLVAISSVVDKLGMTGWNRGSEFNYFPGSISSRQFLDELDFFQMPPQSQAADSEGDIAPLAFGTKLDLKGLHQFSSGGTDYIGLEMIKHEDGIGTIWIAIPESHDLETGPIAPLVVLCPDIVTPN